MLRHIKQGSPLNGSVPVDVPKGTYAAYMVVLDGTTDTAQTLDPADVGRIRLERRGRQLIGTTFEFLHDVADLHGGFPTAVLPEAGASRVTAFIPCSIPGIPNVMDVDDKEEVDIHLDFDSDALSTAFGTNPVTYRLYGVPAPYFWERYELIISEQNMQASGATVLNETLNGRNIAHIYFRDAGDAVDAIQLIVDGEVAVDNIDDAAIQDLTNWLNQVETAGNEWGLLDNAPLKTIQEVVNKTSELKLNFTSSGTVELFMFRAGFRGEGHNPKQSRARYKEALRKKFGGNLPDNVAQSLPQGAVR